MRTAIRCKRSNYFSQATEPEMTRRCINLYKLSDMTEVGLINSLDLN